MLRFLAGAVFGGTVGVLVMAVLVAGKRADERATALADRERRPYIEL